MTFSSFCVGCIIIIIIAAVTFLLDRILSFDTNDSGFYSWLINSIGFGVCLTILLYQNGVIK